MTAEEIRNIEVKLDNRVRDEILREIAAQLAELNDILREVLPVDELNGKHQFVVNIGRGGPGSVG